MRKNWKMRSIWSGAIAFGLVSVPVRMASAVEEYKLHFNYVHEPDGGRIGYQKVCKAEDRSPSPEDEIVKAFEVKKGKWIYLEDEDFESAALEKAQRTIDIQAFVQEDQIDPVFFERSFFLTPQDGGEKVYALLARAMEETGLVAVATFVMRDRQYLACLRVRERVIQLERMHFADEIRPAKGLHRKEFGSSRRISTWRSSLSSVSKDHLSRRSTRTAIAMPSSRSSAPRSAGRPFRSPKRRATPTRRSI